MSVRYLNQTEARIQATGASEVYAFRAAEFKIQKAIAAASTTRDPYRGILDQKQTAWSWDLAILHEVSNTASRLLMLRAIGAILDPDKEPPSFTIEVTDPEGKIRRFADARVVSLVLTFEKRKLVSIDAQLKARKQREQETPMEVTEPDELHQAVTGNHVTVEIDGAPTPTHEAVLAFNRQDYGPANFDTGGEARCFNGAGQWGATAYLRHPADDMPVNNPVGEKSIEVKIQGIGSIAIPTAYGEKPEQTFIADDFDDREIYYRATTAPGKNLVEIQI